MIPSGDWPHNMAAEQGLLGMMMIDNRSVDLVSGHIRAEHFCNPAHGRIFDAIVKMVNAGQEAKPTTLAPYFSGEDPSFADVGGGARYLVELMTEIPLLNDARSYAKSVYDYAARRQLMQAGMEMMQRARDIDIDTPLSAIIEEAEAKLFTMAERTASGAEAVLVSDLTERTIALIERAQTGRMAGVATGIAALDEQLGGLMPDELTILAGRPGMGKTALALTIALNAARAGHGVQFQSLEMGAAQLVQRLLARETGIPVGLQLRTGGMKEHGMTRLIEAAQTLRGLPLLVDESGTITAAQIRARARRAKRKNPNLGLIIVDYLGLVRSTNAGAQRVHQLGEISKMMKATAKDLHVHVLLLAQVNRGVEAREDKRCSLSDLRDSGEIEEDADIVLFPYREEYYLKKNEPHRKIGETDEKFNERCADWEARCEDGRGRAELAIGKFRRGNPSTVKCAFDGNRQYFYDLS